MGGVGVEVGIGCEQAPFYNRGKNVPFLSTGAPGSPFIWGIQIENRTGFVNDWSPRDA